MEPRISIITLGVSDLARSVQFYKETLGLPLSSHSVENKTAFFELSGTWLGLYPREELAKDADAKTRNAGLVGITLSHNLRSEQEVKDFFQMLIKKGALIAKEPTRADWGGYSGYFKDPDGYLWEVAYNPNFWAGPKV
jgi:hypothetical protein